MSKKRKLTLEQEANVLYYLEYQRGRQMKGESRTNMYEVYRYFRRDRDKDVCSCLDRDTFKKVDNHINHIDWSDETRSSEKMKKLLPNEYVESIPEMEEEISTQPIDMSEVLQNMNNKTTTPQDDVSQLKKPTKRRGRPKKKK